MMQLRARGHETTTHNPRLHARLVGIRGLCFDSGDTAIWRTWRYLPAKI